MKKAMFILNPSSGKEKASDYREQVIFTLESMGIYRRYKSHRKARRCHPFCAGSSGTAV